MLLSDIGTLLILWSFARRCTYKHRLWI